MDAGADAGVVDSGPPCGTFVVGPHYASAAEWNQYVAADGPDRLRATGAPCDVTSRLGYYSCIHGGELRSVRVPGLAACSGVSAADTLNALQWRCQAAPDGGVWIASSALKDDRGLRDLIDLDAGVWRENRLELRVDGGLFCSSAPAQWWSTPIVSLANRLDGGGAIIVVRNDDDGPIRLERGEALLVAPGQEFGLPDASYPDASVNVINASSCCTWVEGNINAARATFAGFRGTGISQSVLRHVVIHDTQPSVLSRGLIYLTGSSSNLLWDVTAANAPGTGCNGIFLNGLSHSNTLVGVRTYNHANVGITIREAGLNGVERPLFNRLVGVLVAGSGDVGIRIRNSPATVLLDATSANHLNRGVVIDDGPASLLMNVASINNEATHFEFRNSPDTTVVNVLASDSITGPGILIDSSNDMRFRGQVRVGNNGATNAYHCEVVNTVNSGATEYLCYGSNHTTQLSTSAASPNVVGPYGQTLHDSISGGAWGLLNPMETWARSGAYDNAASHGFCAPGTVCARWSFGTGGSAFSGLPENTSGNYLDHDWQVSDATTCGLMPGAVWASNKCVSTFLRNAVEIFADGIGNENGLCESGERCMQTRNIGAYQGTGTLRLLRTVAGSSGGPPVEVYGY